MTFVTRLWNKLGARLTVLFLALALLPLLAVGYLAYENGRETIEQQQISHLDTVNALKADELDRWVRDSVERLSSLAQRPLVQGLAAALAARAANRTAIENVLVDHLRPALAKEEGYKELFLLRAGDGLILASTNEEDLGKFRESESYFREGRQRPTVQNVYYEPSRGEPTMTVGTPVRDSSGEVVAVLAGHLNLVELEEIARQTGELTETEDTYLVNSFNFFVTEPRFGEGYALQEATYAAGVEKCLEGQSGHGLYTDYRGEEVLGAYRWLPEWEMCILTEIDRREAFGPIDNLRQTLISLGTMVALGVVGTGLFFTRSITRPLRQLTRGAKRIGQGELEHRIDVQSSDEIGQLARAFNEMTENLHRSLGETAHGRRLLLALGDAAQAVQRAHTSEEVYETLGEEVVRLGFNAAVLTLTADQKRARLAYLGYDSSLIKLAEKLVGVTAADYEFPLPKGGTYRRALDEGETVFIEQTSTFIAEALPARAQRVAGRLSTLLGMDRSIVAPLMVDGETLGLLTVSGDGLAGADVTAVKAFANQTAIALKNAKLYEEIRASEARLRTIFQSAGAGIAHLDLEGRIVEGNARLQEILGYSADELQAKPLADFCHPDDASTDAELYRSLIAGEREKYQVEKRYVHSDGQTVWALLSVSLVRDGCDEPQFAVVLMDDVTQRKEIEQERAEQQAFLESIYSGVELSIFVVDVGQDGAFHYRGFNPVHERLWGLKTTEAQGKTPQELAPFIASEAAAAIRNNYARCVEAGTAIEYEEMIPMEGRETWWLTRLSPIRDADGCIYRIVGTSLSITERKRIQQELRKYQDHLEELVEERTAELQQSESRFRALFSAVPVPVVVTDAATGEILEANEHVAGTLHLAADNVVGSNVRDVYADASERGPRVQQILENGHVRGHELTVRRGDGKLASLLLSTSTIEYDGRQALLSSLVDLTERKKMEEALRNSEERFRALVQNASDTITVVDGQGCVQYDSPSIERILGYEPDERLGEPIFKYAHPDELPAVAETFEQLLSEPNTKVTLDATVSHRDGSWRTVEVTASNLLNDPAVQGIVVNFHDVTARKTLEDALRRERDRFNSLLQTSPVGITFVNRDRQITFANPRAEKVLGLSLDEIADRTYHAPSWRITDHDGNPFPESDLPFNRARETGRPVHDVQHAIEKPSGERVLLSINATPVFDNKGSFDGIVTTVQDITERKRAQAQLEKYAADLARSNEELQQFAYVASHDLQEPLRMVSSFLQLLQQRYEDQLDERADQYIYYAVDGAARMKRLINDLLQYSRVATKGQPLAPTESQVVVEQVLRDLSVTIEESSATVSHDALPKVMADETQLRRLFQNLIGNAIKFRGDRAPQIHVAVERKNGMWQFAVSDNGVGIDPRFQERIFVIFQRLHRDEKYDGTGIGLAVCRRIVQYHDGDIWVESEPGVGSTFYFTLPAVREEDSEFND